MSSWNWIHNQLWQPPRSFTVGTKQIGYTERNGSIDTAESAIPRSCDRASPTSDDCRCSSKVDWLQVEICVPPLRDARITYHQCWWPSKRFQEVSRDSKQINTQAQTFVQAQVILNGSFVRSWEKFQLCFNTFIPARIIPGESFTRKVV